MGIKATFNDLMNGGDTKAAQIGRTLGIVINRSTKLAGISLIALALVAFGQFGQFMASSSDIRMNAISAWSESNPKDKDLAAKFIAVCVVGRPLDSGDMPSEVIGVYKCGESIGASNLVASVKLADSSLSTVSWPLSLIN